MNKPVDFFKCKLVELNSCIANFVSTTSNDNENAQEELYRVSYWVAKALEVHTIAENLIGPCIKDVVQCMLAEKAAKKIDIVPFSNNNLSRRINDISSYVEITVVQRVKKSQYYAFQLDESMDVANLAILLVFVRYINEDTGIAEEVLYCSLLKERTTGEYRFKLTNAYFAENEIDWSHCIGICTDGATSVMGKHAGFVAQTKEVVTSISWTHCCIHRQALASKRMPQGLKEVLDNKVKIVIFIKLWPTNSRIFQVLCEEMGSLHNCLLTHTEVRWLSRGKVLVHFFELKAEIAVFFLSKSPFTSPDVQKTMSGFRA
jgi:hypothetical protein